MNSQAVQVRPGYQLGIGYVDQGLLPMHPQPCAKQFYEILIPGDISGVPSRTWAITGMLSGVTPSP